MAKTILITGASSGIGAALAWACAKQGLNLALTARRLEQLEQLAEQIRNQYQIQVEVAALDVCDVNSIRPIMQGLSQLMGRIDVVVINAGVLSTRRLADGNINQDITMLNTNVVGAIATSDAAIEVFKLQAKAAGWVGHLAVVSSYSAFMPLTSAPAYAASKAAVSHYFEAIRPRLKSLNIDLTLIYPGFVNTDLLQGLKVANLPIAQPEQVAAEILTSINQHKASAIVPRLPWQLIYQLQRFTPNVILKQLNQFF